MNRCFVTTRKRILLLSLWSFIAGFYVCVQFVGVFGYNKNYQGSLLMAAFTVVLLVVWHFIELKRGKRDG